MPGINVHPAIRATQHLITLTKIELLGNYLSSDQRSLSQQKHPSTIFALRSRGIVWLHAMEVHHARFLCGPTMHFRTFRYVYTDYMISLWTGGDCRQDCKRREIVTSTNQLTHCILSSLPSESLRGELCQGQDLLATLRPTLWLEWAVSRPRGESSWYGRPKLVTSFFFFSQLRLVL